MIGNKIDLIGSAVLLILGGAILLTALTYNIGTATRMGPGYFPMVLGGVIMVLALIIGAASVRGAPPHRVAFAWRPFAAVIASIGGFITGMAYGGLLPAVVLTILISSFGDARSRVLPVLVLALAVAIAAWLIFSRVLAMPIPLFRVPF